MAKWNSEHLKWFILKILIPIIVVNAQIICEYLKDVKTNVNSTSVALACSQLNRKVPNKQLYRWSKIVINMCSLNSKALGNYEKKNDILHFHSRQPWASMYSMVILSLISKLMMLWPMVHCCLSISSHNRW